LAAFPSSQFTKIFTFDGSSYTDVTLEAQSPAGTAFSALSASNHWLYLGHDSKFDMAIFDVAVAGSLGALSWYYHNGSAWIEFVPASGRYEIDPDDSEGAQYAFDKDGAELFPPNLLSDWATNEINSTTKYWVRVSTASVSTAPTIKRIQMRAYEAYTTTRQVYELLQLKNVLSGTDFTSSTVPSKATVEQYIMEAQSHIDMNTRKSWRPNYVAGEYHQFNLGGIKLDKPDVYKILSLKIWNGSSWDTKTQGRTGDFFLVPDTGMIQFSRYFLLPARFTNISSARGAWGGGEFTMPIKINYLSGRDIETDVRQGGIVQNMAKKLSAVNVIRNSDFGGAVVSGMDRIGMESRVAGWEAETADIIDGLKAFETF